MSAATVTSGEKVQTEVRDALIDQDMFTVRRGLEKAGSPDAIVLEKEGWTSLHLAACTSSEGVMLLLKHGAETDIRDEQGRTPLHVAAYHGCLAAVEGLLSGGADFTMEDDAGMTPLDLALVRKYETPDAAPLAAFGELFKETISQKFDLDRVIGVLNGLEHLVSRGETKADLMSLSTAPDNEKLAREFLEGMLAEGNNPLEDQPVRIIREMQEKYPDIIQAVFEKFG